MPAQTVSQANTHSTRGRKRALSPAADREDSVDTSESEVVTWEWIFSTDPSEHGEDGEGDRKRRKIATSPTIVGARYGDFECRIGDTVMLKADGSNGSWVAIICDFQEDNDKGEMTANFMWFLTEKEVPNKERKRKDFYWVRTAPAVLHPLFKQWISNTDSRMSSIYHPLGT